MAAAGMRMRSDIATALLQAHGVAVSHQRRIYERGADRRDTANEITAQTDAL